MRVALFLLLIPLLGLASPLASAQGGPSAADPAALAERLRDLRELLGRLESLESQLIAQVQEAQAHAEAAADHEARARYERLATETGARLSELRATRDQLQEQIKRFEQALGSFPKADR